MADLQRLAQRLGVSDRTLRRAARRGLIRAQIDGPRRTRLTAREHGYLLRIWPLLGQLQAALRTEPGVRLAVLFGSLARGDDHPDSDVDALVALRDVDRARLSELEARLAQRVGREVQLLALRDAEREPTLLADIVHDGRVLVDRDGRWPALARREAQLRHDGETALDARARRALTRIATL